jgi:hypothetical protein
MTDGIWGLRTVARWWRRRRRLVRLVKVGVGASTADVPERLPPGEAILIGDDAAWKWLVLGCPCCCGDVHWVNLMRDASPRWSAQMSTSALVSVRPSLAVITRCRSHFWIRDSRIEWC